MIESILARLEELKKVKKDVFFLCEAINEKNKNQLALIVAGTRA